MGFARIALLALAWPACVGCAISPGKGISLFPQGHRLTPEAQAVKSSYSEAVNLPRELAKAPLPPYSVEPGDVLLVQATELDSPIRLPSDQAVMPDGTISLGKYGQLSVSGKSLVEIEADAKAAIARLSKDASGITVRLLSRSSKVYYVLGEVSAPGVFPLSGRETVLDAIVAAGGLTERASRRDIVLSRPTGPTSCRIVLPICYREIVQLGDTSTNYQIAPGDRIYVATSSFWEDLMHGGKSCLPCGRAACPCGPEQISALPGKPQAP